MKNRFKVFDFHTHIFPDAIAERALKRLAYGVHIAPYTDGTLDGTVERMKNDGVDGFLTLHIATNEKQQTSVNDFAIMVNDGGQAQAFGSVFPLSKAALQEIERLYKVGIKGIKLHPEYQQFSFTDPMAYKVYEICRDLGLKLVFHAGYDPAFPGSLRCSVQDIKKVAKNFKGLTMIAAHFGCFLDAAAAEKELAGKVDVMLDTGCSVGFVNNKLAESIINKHGAENILFASDCPWGSPKAHIEFIDGLNLTDNQKELIFYKNAENLLK